MIGDTNDYAFQFAVSKTYQIPEAISSLAFGHAFHLYAGSRDGSLRVYDLSNHKVTKAIRSLDGEVSSIVCMKRPGSELRDAWIAHGNKISKFQLDSQKMILSPNDAEKTIEVGENADDAVNELALHYNKTHLGFGTDTGTVAVVDLDTYKVSKLKNKHTSICGSVQFIADRGRDIVSAGFDHMFLHHDFVQDELISQATIPPMPTIESNATMAPPFIMSFGISSTGVVAGGTACGRLWIGIGGEKRRDRKKTKKWEGLSPSESASVAAAQGPIVSLRVHTLLSRELCSSKSRCFSEPRVFTTSTLLGVITQWEVIFREEDRQILLKMLWQGTTQNMEKVNKVIADDKRIIVAGLTKEGKGVIEVWHKRPSPPKTSGDSSGRRK